MPIIYRNEKGAPLTSEEIDNNFRTLVERLIQLESKVLSVKSGESIGSIHVEGDRMRILGTQGSDFGAFKLPTVSFHPRGYWQSGKAYAAYDVVYKGLALYVCLTAHVSEVFEKEQHIWQVLLDITEFYAQSSQKP